MTPFLSFIAGQRYFNSSLLSNLTLQPLPTSGSEASSTLGVEEGDDPAAAAVDPVGGS